jgi:hypothetical protein
MAATAQINHLFQIIFLEYYFEIQLLGHIMKS